MNLNLGTIKIPINAATKTFAILAKRGAGKTYTGGVLAEEFFKQNIPFVVFDPIDVWWGLRIAADGQGKGLPIVVFGKQHADIELQRDMGRRIAQAVIKENISCVISTFGLPKKAQRHLVAEFSDEILTINNSPRHIFIEEAHEYVPQRVMGAMGVVFNSVSNLVVMGRNQGLGVTLLNQRAATVNKDVLTQIDTLIAMRSLGPQDRKALKEWVEAHAVMDDFDKFIRSLPSLPTGEGWIWSPEFMNVFERIKIRQRETFHPDREKIGSNFVMPEFSRIDIQSFIRRFNEEPSKKNIPKTDSPSKQSIRESDHQKMRQEIANEYESKIIGLESENRRLKALLDSIRELLLSYEYKLDVPIQANSNKVVQPDTISMWLSKLGNSGAARIFQFLADNRPKGFTRQQIALAVTMKHSGGSFATYLSRLRSNRLVIKEGQEFKLNPDL